MQADACQRWLLSCSNPNLFPGFPVTVFEVQLQIVLCAGQLVFIEFANLISIETYMFTQKCLQLLF